MKSEAFWIVIAWLAFCAVAVIFIPSKCHAAETMRASYYGSESGSRTASGERFRPSGMTAAHRTLPFGTRLRVCYQSRCVVVRVTDRGPYIRGRQLDLSKGAARAVGMLHVGVASVQVERLK
jgi:rare lipoprotein A